jgi:predicted transposase YbfD/YdcC
MIKDGAGKVPGLLAVLALVPDPRRLRGRRFSLVFVLAVAAACTLAGARTFREVGDQAADLPQEVLRALGGRMHPLRRRIAVPSETRIRTLVHAVNAQVLDEILGGWLRDLADAGRPDGLLRAVAIDGKWLRGVADGQVKLFAAMLQEEKAVIAQHRVPDETTETTQVRELLDAVDLRNAVVTADAAHAQRETAAYIAGPEEEGGRDADYLLLVKGNQPSLQRAAFDAIQGQGPREPGFTELDRSHGRTVRRSVWVADAGEIEFPHVRQVARIRRDRYDADGQLISKEIVHAVTSLDAARADAACLAALARGQWGIESVHWIRDTAYAEDANSGYAGNGPQIMATLRNLAVSLLYLSGVTEITRTLQAIGRDRNRILDYLPL